MTRSGAPPLLPRWLLAVAALTLAAGTGFAAERHFTARGAISIDEPVPGDALLAGGSVAVRASVGGDLYVAGGQVEVAAPVAGDVNIAAGQVHVDSDATLHGAANIVGGRLVLEGTYEGRLKAAGGHISLGGHALGDVVLRAGDIRLAPGTRIDGRLVYNSPEAILIPADAQVAGGVERGSRTFGRPLGRFEAERWRHGHRYFHWWGLAGFLLVGAIYLAAFREFAARTHEQIAQQPWTGLGVGLLTSLVVPIAAVLLCITIVGIPLALIGLMAYGSLIILGYVVGALYLSDTGLTRTRGADYSNRLGWRLGALTLVLLGLAALRAVPVIGFIAHGAVWLLGVGGLTLVLVGQHTRDPAQAR